MHATACRGRSALQSPSHQYRLGLLSASKSCTPEGLEGDDERIQHSFNKEKFCATQVRVHTWHRLRLFVCKAPAPNQVAMVLRQASVIVSFCLTSQQWCRNLRALSSHLKAARSETAAVLDVRIWEPVIIFYDQCWRWKVPKLECGCKKWFNQCFANSKVTTSLPFSQARPWCS